MNVLIEDWTERNIWYSLVRLPVVLARRGDLGCVAATRQEGTIAIAGRAIRPDASWCAVLPVSIIA